MRLSLLAVFMAFMVIGMSAYGQTVDQEAEGQEKKTQEEQANYLYQWTDSKGVVHITDSLEKVPHEYRSEAQKQESQSGAVKTENQTGRQKLTPNANDMGNEQLLSDQKQEWQARIKTAKQRLSDAELRYAELERQRDIALRSWGGPASGQLSGREEAARIEQEMNKVQQEIDDARRQLEIVIPDEARKAGVPPGWLRE